MRGTIIERQMRRCNRNLLLVNVGVIGLMLLWAILEQRYLYNCVAGPFPVAAADLQTMYPASGKQEFLAVREELQPVDTGVYRSHTTNGTETGKDYFLAARIGGRLLLINSTSSTPDKHYEGTLAPIPTGIRNLIESDIRKRGEVPFDTLFLPFMLDASSYRFDAYLAIGLGLPILGLCLYNVKKALARMEDVQHSPIYLAVKRYGDDVDHVANMLEADASSGEVKKYGAFTLTPSWLLHKTFFSFTPFHLSDIVWIYRKQTQYFYYVVPTGKSHAIVVADAAGRQAETDLGRGKSAAERVDEFIKSLSARVPWVSAGYSDELKNFYESNLREFVSAVAERKREIESR